MMMMYQSVEDVVEGMAMPVFGGVVLVYLILYLVYLILYLTQKERVQKEKYGNILEKAGVTGLILIFIYYALKKFTKPKK